MQPFIYYKMCQFKHSDIFIHKFQALQKTIDKLKNQNTKAKY